MTRLWWMTMRFLRAAVTFAALLLPAACQRGGAGDEDAEADTAGADAAQTCRVTQPSVALPSDVAESSGAAFDPRAEGVFWTHGDSGADPILYALAADGQLAGRVLLTGARNRDWEDLAVGPCPAGDCLYVADIGDNRGNRNDPVLYRAPLPQLTDTATAPAEVFRARFPGGGRDTEALFVTADGGVYLVNKGQRDDIELWRWPTPLQAGATVDLVRVRVLAPEPRQPGDAVTGAGASRDGRWVAVRTYGRLALYRTADLLGSGGSAFSMDLAPLGEPQGEGVAMRPDGTVLLTSESGGHGLAAQAAWLQCPLR